MSRRVIRDFGHGAPEPPICVACGIIAAGALVGELGCRVEFNGVHYGAIDLAPDVSADEVIDVLTPHHDAGYLIWEWADPAGPASE